VRRDEETTCWALAIFFFARLPPLMSSTTTMTTTTTLYFYFFAVLPSFFRWIYRLSTINCILFNENAHPTDQENGKTGAQREEKKKKKMSKTWHE
jgi:hypothetical protein